MITAATAILHWLWVGHCPSRCVVLKPCPTTVVSMSGQGKACVLGSPHSSCMMWARTDAWARSSRMLPSLRWVHSLWQSSACLTALTSRPAPNNNNETKQKQKQEQKKKNRRNKHHWLTFWTQNIMVVNPWSFHPTSIQVPAYTPCLMCYLSYGVLKHPHPQ